MNIERHVQQRSMLRFWSGDGQDLRQRAGLLVEHRRRRWRPCSGAATARPYSPSATALIAVLRLKTICSPLPSGPPVQPVWKRPRLNGAVPLKQSVSRDVERRVRRGPRGASPVSIGVTPIQCCCWSCALLAPSESAYWLDAAFHHVAVEARRAGGRRASSAQRSVVAVALGRGHLGEVGEPADQVDGVVELLLAHALALDVAEALGPAVLVGVEVVDDVAHGAPREVVEPVEEAVVAAPAPHERDGARELDRLVGVAGVRVRAEVDRAVGDDLVRDLARLRVEPVRHLLERDQVGLDRLELAERDRRVRRVLAVGGEQPRVVGVAGADERDPVERRRSGAGRPCRGRRSGSAGPRPSA